MRTNIRPFLRFAAFFLVLALAVAKFGVLDLYDRLADAQSAYAQAQQENRAAQEKLSHFDEVLSEYRTYSMEWMEDGEDSDLNFAVERTEMLDLIERTVMPYGTLSALQAQGDRVDVELNETDLDRIAEALSAVKVDSRSKPFRLSSSQDTAYSSIYTEK